MPEVSELFDLRAWLAAEIAREEERIRKHCAAGLMRREDQAYMRGLARNTVRRQILKRLDTAIAESAASANTVGESKPGTTLLNEHPDTARLNWLETALVSYGIGNGIALFPSSDREDNQRYMLQDLGDEDGSNLGDELCATCDTLRAAIDAAREGKR